VTRQTFSSVNRKSPGTSQTFHNARALHAQQRTREAEQLYKRALKSDDRHFPSLYHLGLLYLQQGRFDEAARSFRRAINVDRQSAEAHHHLGVALMSLELPEQAIRRYETALSIRPDLAGTHNNLGHALQTIGRNQDAIEHYKKALAIRPAYPEAHNNLGNALLALGRVEEAIARYKEALAIRPNYVDACINLGNALARLGHHQAAVASFDKAIALTPKYAEAYHSLGNALGMMGRHEEAIVSYRNALALRPQDADLHFRFGKACEALGRHEEALKSYDQALTINPTHVGALAGRGYELKMFGKYVDAAKVLEGLVQRGVCSADLLLGLANMPASVITIDLLAQLDKVTRQDGEDQAKFENSITFARTAALDRAGRHAEAWEHLVPANRAVFLASQEAFGEVAARQSGNLARLRQSSARQPGATGDGGQVISLFILGPSRCGKTTLESLVHTLDGVKSGYEDFSVENAVTRTFQAAALRGSPLLENLPPRLHPSCRDAYLAELAERAGSAKIFTSTNPGRIHDADLVAAVFPNVRFLLLKRDLDDNLLRIYQRKYNTGNFFSYDLKAARDHILWYHEMMMLLAERFPRIVRVLQYEAMIADPAAALRVAAELCGVPGRASPLPAIADDRGCAIPYRQYIAAELER
jgi:tetratricopeptide (TPR) repeat protein